jgi:hypothetical protein
MKKWQKIKKDSQSICRIIMLAPIYVFVPNFKKALKSLEKTKWWPKRKWKIYLIKKNLQIDQKIIPFMGIIYEHTFYNKLTIKFDQFGWSILYMNWIWTNDCTIVHDHTRNLPWYLYGILLNSISHIRIENYSFDI